MASLSTLGPIKLLLAFLRYIVGFQCPKVQCVWVYWLPTTSAIWNTQMGNAVQALSPRRRRASAQVLDGEKPAGKKKRAKNKKQMISQANKLKFRVSHLLATKIKKKFEDGSIPQTGVHAHHHMVATHMAKDTSLIHKNRRSVRAELVHFVLV